MAMTCGYQSERGGQSTLTVLKTTLNLLMKRNQSFIITPMRLEVGVPIFHVGAGRIQGTVALLKDALAPTAAVGFDPRTFGLWVKHHYQQTIMMLRFACIKGRANHVDLLLLRKCRIYITTQKCSSVRHSMPEVSSESNGFESANE